MSQDLGSQGAYLHRPERRLARSLELAVSEARQQMEHYFETPGLRTTPGRSFRMPDLEKVA